MTERRIYLVVRGMGTRSIRESELTANERSLVGTHWNYLHNGLGSSRRNPDPSIFGSARWLQYEETEIGGHYLETDPDVIYEWANDGEFDFDDIYEEVS